MNAALAVLKECTAIADQRDMREMREMLCSR